MSEQTDRELLMDIRERLVVIETEIKNYSEVQNKAEKALTLAKENKREIDEIKNNNKWMLRATITALIMPFLYQLITHNLF